jgi:hypothetical protein
VALSLTLGLIFAGALGWLAPALHCRRANLPAGVLPVCAVVALLHRRVHAAMPRSITESWHAVGLLLSVLILVDVSILMTGSGGGWC